MKIGGSTHSLVRYTFLFVITLVLYNGIRAEEIRRENTAIDPTTNVLNIHIVAHSHDDLGWLKTVEQYYNGQNSTLQQACVRCILDSVVSALTAEPDRKFTFVEIAFFSMWWEDQVEAIKESVRKLVKNGQLSFANGGWCMHDEATTHFMGMIDQTTLGHEFLKQEFDYIPSVGWQIDPFGHSATQASLFTSETGFNALYFGRIDYQDLEQRRAVKECEGIWKPSPNLEDTSVFWGLTGSYMGNYGAPEGFCFDIFCFDDPLIGLKGDKLQSRMEDFFRKVKLQAERTRGNNIMLTMGSDFQFQNAMQNFQNLDFLITTINNATVNYSNFFPGFDNINAFYSTPEIYTTYKYNEVKESISEKKGSLTKPKFNYSIKIDDFFPYSDCDHCFWAGYFTSRPGLKKLERVGSSFLHAARQIQALFGDVNKSHDKSEIYNLESAIGIAQHHDAVSGTSKQHVAYDYAKTIQAAIDGASKFAANIIKKRLSPYLSNLSYCQQRNISICEVSQAATLGTNTDIYVVAYNALPWTRADILSLPVSSQSTYVVEREKEGLIGTDPSWVRVSSTLFANLNPANVSDSAPWILYFETGLILPISLSLYRIRNEGQKSEDDIDFRGGLINNTSSIKRSLRKRQDLQQIMDKNMFTVKNDRIEVQFQQGVMTKITNFAQNFSISIGQEWGYYTSFQDDSVKGEDAMNKDEMCPFNSKIKEYPWSGNAESTQLSGAYIFRPSSPTEVLNKILSDPKKTKILRDDFITEIHTGFEVPWVKQITRIIRGQPYIDIEYTIGPIPFDDGKGKEIVTRYSSDIESNGIFHTDSNGREFIVRERSKRQSYDFEEFEPIAGNYYPVNAAIFLEDDNFAMSVLPDRSQGGTSLTDGVLELMVQRRTIQDDARGVGEPMNETDIGIAPYPPYGDASRRGKGVIITGTHRVLFGKGKTGASLARSQMDAMFSPLHLFAASSPSSSNLSFHHGDLSALKKNLPRNVQLITTKIYSPRNEEGVIILLRLGHAYALGESDEFSMPVEIDLSTLFHRYLIKSCDETTLTGNQDRAEWSRRKMTWIGGRDKKGMIISKVETSDGHFLIQLSPMEIKTFKIYAVINS